ncbi:MAG: membrane protein insertion efficiency factor YidD [Chlamydiales bacterium]
MIRFFQNYISPIDGPRSSFYPSSSQYTFEAIQKYGVFRGISMGCDRLMRENNETWIYKNIKKEGIQLKIDLLQ